MEYNKNISPIIMAGDYNMRSNEIIPWPPHTWSSAPLLSTFDSKNDCVIYNGKFSHPLDRCLYKKLTLIDTTLIGIDPIGSDHYGLMNIFKL
jgi:endonuclease/exonuclease/phosphatase (EEP) superfamily protein YafD